ncbi:LysE family translocator [bacterium]|nr:LysE family translocator [bacterium]
MITTDFLLSSLLVVLIPGTGVIYTITTGLQRNWRAGVVAAFGCTLGIVPHMLASIFGLSAILNMSAQIFSMIKFAGAAYLLYLAWNMWRETGMLSLDEKFGDSSWSKIIGKAVAINLLNPKLTIFFFAFFPLFITDRSGSPTFQMLTLSLVFMGLTFVVFVGYGLLASSVRHLLLKSTRAVKRIQQGFAIVLAGFAVKLALRED